MGLSRRPREVAVAKGEDRRGVPSLTALKVLSAFLKELTAEELKRVPFLGGTIAALQKLSEEEAAQEAAERIDRLVALTEHGDARLDEIQTDIDVLTGLSAAVFSMQPELLAWVQASSYAVQPAELTSFGLEGALLAYHSRVAVDYLYADHRGIVGAGREQEAASLPLDEVYVMPRLLPDRNRIELHSHERQLLRMLDDPDLPPERRSTFEEEYAAATGARWRPSGDHRVALSEVFATARHSVVLGGPGVGKSVLTRYLARSCALGARAMSERLGWGEDLTPIVISIAAFADARGQQPRLGLREYFDQRMTDRGGEVLRLAISGRLENGSALVLLDGIDEVPDQRARTVLVKAVDEFLRDHASSRCIVTSRPFGYVPLAGALPHFQLPNFSTDQVREFLCGWHRAFERRRHPDASDLAAAAADANDLYDELERHPKVLELATNPLMLIIVSLIRYEEVRLPEQRVELYNRAIITLMDTWNAMRSQSTTVLGSAALPRDRLIRVWGAAARWMRENKPTGVVHRAELTRHLVRVLTDQELDEHDPEATAESYLAAAADKAGLLEERAHDIFGFWHPTFEEFLAAVDLATPASRAVDKILPLRDDPRWREVIMLAVGYVGVVQRDPDTATEIVEALLRQGPVPAMEPFLHSRLRLAAACIADDASVRRSMAQEVIRELAQVVAAQPYAPLISTFARMIQALPRLRPTDETLAALEPLTSHPDWEVRMEATRLFSNVTETNPLAHALCERMLKDVDDNVRCHAALGLARAGDRHLEVWRELTNFRSSRAHIRKAVREFLTPIGR